jgi:hypothetical protein
VQAGLDAKSFQAEAGAILRYLRFTDRVNRYGSELTQATAALHRAMHKVKAWRGDEAFISIEEGPPRLHEDLQKAVEICGRERERTISAGRHEDATELLRTLAALKELSATHTGPAPEQTSNKR